MKPGGAGARSIVAGGALVLALLACDSPPARQNEPTLGPAISGATASASTPAIPPPSETAQTILLEQGELLLFEVEQQGVDLALFLEDPSGERRIEIDSPNGDRGIEWIDWIAESAGEHRVVLRRLGGSGSYRVLRFERRLPTARDRARAAATRETAAGLADWRQGKSTAASRFAHAARLWRGLPDSDDEQLTSLLRWAEAARRNRDPVAALTALETAAKLTRGTTWDGVAADIENTRAVVFNDSARFREALAAAGRALGRADAAGKEDAVAVAYGNLGSAYQGLGEFDSAFSNFAAAEAMWRRLERPRAAAVIKYNLGTLLNATARFREAADVLREALALFDPQADRRVIGFAQTHLAVALFELHDDGWRTEIATALATLRSLGDPSALAGALSQMAGLAFQSGDFSAAEQYFAEALQLHTGYDDQLGEAFARASRAWMEQLRGRPAACLADLDLALPVFAHLDNATGQAFALLARARAEGQLGRPEEALASAGAALDALEKQRTQVPEPVWRMVFLDPRLDYFDTYVDLAMELHARFPGAGYELAALAATERGRARGLLDQLAARHEGDSSAAGPFAPRPVATLGSLREPETTYLVFYSSRSRAYLWSLGPAGLRAFDLGPTPALEEEVRANYLLLAARSRYPDPAIRLAELARRLLPAAALPAGDGRLVVVGDGLIRYVPFALLPDPATAGPLVERFTISHLPSLSLLASLRSLPSVARKNGHELVVIADPALKVLAAPLQGPLSRAAESHGFLNLPPLPHSRAEAESLLGMVPAGERLALFGTAARRDAVLRGFLDPYRLVHFATHGLFDADDVHRSGLVLAQRDAEERRLDGFLSFTDIGKTRLTADLVVASACNTAMGRDLRGEGPVGVSQAFLAAGARRTIGSLWRIDDRNTARFMPVFYRALLVDRMSPAAALRHAQLHFLEHEKPGSQTEWGAFVLVGEYL